MRRSLFALFAGFALFACSASAQERVGYVAFEPYLWHGSENQQRLEVNGLLLPGSYTASWTGLGLRVLVPVHVNVRLEAWFHGASEGTSTFTPPDGTFGALHTAADFSSFGFGVAARFWVRTRPVRAPTSERRP